MFAASIITTAAALFASVSIAAPTQRDAAQPIFNLTATSLDGTKYENVLLGAAHSGAAIEALAADGYPTPFSFNETTSAPIGEGDSNPGYLVYTLGSEPEPYQQAAQFLEASDSNVDAIFFGTGGEPQLFYFASNGQLFHYESTSEGTSYFYLCPQTYASYQYNTLSFVAHGTKPTDTLCDEVVVKRVAV